MGRLGYRRDPLAQGGTFELGQGNLGDQSSDQDHGGCAGSSELL